MPRNELRMTRLELMRNRSNIKMASRGLELLRIKRASLVLAFFSLAKEIRSMMGNLLDIVEYAEESVKIAEIYSGRIQIERIASEQSRVGASVEVQNIMGVKIPSVETTLKDDTNIPYQLVSIPAPVHDAKHNFTEAFKMLVEIAEKEESLRRILKEIDKLNRRSNSIENVIIPRMQSNVRTINQGLEGIERDQLVSLKFIKGKIGERG